MANAFNNLRALANGFLEKADRYCDEVSAYLNGSNDNLDIAGYVIVKEAYKVFIKAYNEFFGAAYDDCIDYDLVESVL